MVPNKKAFNLANTSIFAPICHNHTFHPALSDINLSIWKKKGLATVKDLYIDNVFASFDQLKRKFDLQPTDFFRYLQIRSYARINIRIFEAHNLPGEIYSLLNKDPETKKLVSMFVNVFAAQTAPSTQHLKENIHSCSINARHHLIQYKVVHRLHYSRVNLHSFFPSTRPLCKKYNNLEKHKLSSWYIL